MRGANAGYALATASWVAACVAAFQADSTGVAVAIAGTATGVWVTAILNEHAKATDQETLIQRQINLERTLDHAGRRLEDALIQIFGMLTELRDPAKRQQLQQLIDDTAREGADLGYLHHDSIVAEGFTKLAHIIDNLASETQAIDTYTSRATNGLQTAMEPPLRPDFQEYRQRLFQDFGNHLSSYGKTIADINIKYNLSLGQIEESLRFITVVQGILLKPASKARFRNFLTILNIIERKVLDMKQAIGRLISSLDEFPKLEEAMTNAAEHTARELRELLNYLNLTFEIIQRTRNIGERLL